MKKTISITIMIIFLSLAYVNTVIAADLTIDIDIKPFFSAGETVYFNYTITSDRNQNITFLAHSICPDALITSPYQKNANLITNQPLIDNYYDITIDESIEPQTCTAYIQISSPIQQTVSKDFSIITDPSFSFQLNFCKDQLCMEKSKVFVQGEDIYLDYSSDVDNPSITATLTYPDGTTRTLTLPTSIRAEQIGTHTLDVTASKQSYKDMTVSEQFAVIEKEADIPHVSVCNANGICEEGENEQNCPQDCKPWFDWTSLIYLVIVIVVLLIIVLASSRKKTQPKGAASSTEAIE